MSPRGFHQREYISPYFTSEKYLSSEEHDHDIATMERIETKFNRFVKYPGKLARRVWYRILVWLGYLDDLEKTTYL